MTEEPTKKSFLDGVWLTHRLYQDMLLPITEDYEDDRAAIALETAMENIRDDLINNVLLTVQDHRADELSQIFEIPSRKPQTLAE